MTKRLRRILEILRRLYPEVGTELRHADPLQLLVATILSAQCTDERVNRVTPALFRRYPNARAFAESSATELETFIHSTGFFRSKGRAIREACRQIEEEFGGEVPETMEDLIRLRGVGRKTANVVLGSAFGRNEGVVVDTHVGRLSRRLGLTRQTDPVRVEEELMRQIPRREWTLFSHRLILHGRRVCKAIRPRCGECPLAGVCERILTSPRGKRRSAGPRSSHPTR